MQSNTFIQVIKRILEFGNDNSQFPGLFDFCYKKKGQSADDDESDDADDINRIHKNTFVKRVSSL